jgi:hypothetical protein
MKYVTLLWNSLAMSVRMYVTLLGNSLAMSVRIHGGFTLKVQHYATHDGPLEIIHITKKNTEIPDSM